MKPIKPTIDWLEDPSVFAVNRLPAHSDHRFYETREEAITQKSMKLKYSLNGEWKFQYSVNASVRPVNFFQTDFSSDDWGEINVPGHMQLQGYGTPQYVNTMYPWDGVEALRPPNISKENNPVGSYIKYFSLPENWIDQPVHISFQGVETAFYVWLNGEFIGYSEDSFTPSEFNLTPFLKKGENKLAVEVFQRSTGAWLEDQDFWRFSGIFREVYLYALPNMHATDVRVTTTLDESYTQGTIFVDLKLTNTKGKGVLNLVDQEGKSVASTTMALQDTATLSIEHPCLWSAESPYLYCLYIELYSEEGRLVEVIPQSIGFRKFEMINNVMCINGKRIIFKGVNRHEFHHCKGRAIGEKEMRWDIETLKRNNINAVRTSHYPNQSLWYELCDEYGVYVIDEMNLETHGSWQKMGKVDPSWNIPGNHMEWLPIVKDRAISMYERDKNHPSILIWSCGNESYAGEVILAISNYFRENDSSRLVHYEGVFHNRKYDATSDMESRMYAKPADIEKYLLENPKKPYISCEYMHAMGNSLGGMHKYTELEQKYDMYQGGFIWDYMDQAIVHNDRFGKEYLAYGGDFGDRPTDYEFCGNGIVYANRKVSPKMQEVKYLYQNFIIIPDETGVTIKNQSLFTNTNHYFLTYTLFHEGNKKDQHTVEISIDPQHEGRVTFDFTEKEWEDIGEYSIIASLYLKEDTRWAEKGHEIAFGQYVFQNGEMDKKVNASPYHILRTVEGDVNIGVYGSGFSALFSKQVGSLVSLKYGEEEMISSPPVPLFWRASTDNDRGYQQGYTSGAWFAASLARKCTKVELFEQESSVTVAFTYHFSIHELVTVKVEYHVQSDGSIIVRSKYNGASQLPDLPIFALNFKVPAEYEHLEWYANGPDENYVDRNSGTKLGIFSNTVRDNVANYLRPQESGNRTGVRRLKVINSHGSGMEIQSTDLPLECNASPYTALELESANHVYELPSIHYTVLTIAAKQMGVGGDDSWGAPVHQEYRIDSSKEIEFECKIVRV
ncbi:glycoside hydrolase family 2 TIM barrel-domain containing protein [Bacillus sp. B1-b2]|uniref:glycoside hydrolase family 2 TIM barrel-domain containing protein n=1 Tax=Bacillus sp. B1-b2 TaxID=2653201 RepID=UPI001262900D|nr:glycoside hydrolase family 2 TIM barrel-domain containing protein [Bacillus sp. B1-b2]KAB7666292.1 DUF4981 domain-containing protein [Bacillus sp. B1-b2]